MPPTRPLEYPSKKVYQQEEYGCQANDLTAAHGIGESWGVFIQQEIDPSQVQTTT